MQVFLVAVISFCVLFSVNFSESSIIIVEDARACFRRVLAGKRVARAFVRRSLNCELVEECQRECGDEKRFICEGFNYRLDPSGRGKGDCELLDLPLSRLDIGRDIYPDPDYDYYERDRNAAKADCKQFRPGGGGYYYRRPQGEYDLRGSGHRYGYGDSFHQQTGIQSYDFGSNRRYDYDRPYDLKRPGEKWPQDRPRPYPDYDRRYPTGDRRIDSFQNSHHFQQHYHSNDQDIHHYLPPAHPPSYSNPPRNQWKPSNFGSYGGAYGPFNYDKFDADRKNYLPAKPNPPNWGRYGGSYGIQYQGFGQHDFKYWGFNKLEDKYDRFDGGKGPAYLPPTVGKDFLPIPSKPSFGTLPPRPSFEGHSSDDYDNSLLPIEPRRPLYDFLKDECSLRSAAGFKLHKTIVKKYFQVPNVYECELLCFRERDFNCASFAYRYTLNPASPTENCYLSNKNYKELDYYTDLDPDRDFDIYTMNNVKRCEQPLLIPKDNSECFWRVRSGQRLDFRVVRDSLIVNNIVDCQLECLQSRKFTCRAYSFRYGPRVSPTSSIDNCLLTDWPFYELDPRAHFIPEEGFEVYERGSYGHGCEPDHFQIRGREQKGHDPIAIDQLCYVGFGSPVRLLAQAIRKSLRVESELECKAECSRLREGTLFQCMSFSYRTRAAPGITNCDLSDILQSDLLPNIDYIHDPESWLFAWDNFNPKCITLANQPVHDNHVSGSKEGFDRRMNYDPYAMDTWRVYSVSGWPCRRGSSCRENRETGFWSCELEGGDGTSWDYCCRPTHQCGSSKGYQYQWCYVGPERTQWRKCSDQYYPYVHNYIDRGDQFWPPDYWLPPPNHHPWIPSVSRPLSDIPGSRPNRPPAPSRPPPTKPSLDESEKQFDQQFLAPPKPGGFGQPRRWPLSYLHKEPPPNTTIDESKMMKTNDNNPKYAAIQNLIDVIKSNDLNNVQYHIANDSNKNDDILFVRIPLPTNFTKEAKKSDKRSSLDNNNQEKQRLQPINFEESKNIRREEKSLESTTIRFPSSSEAGDFIKPSPLYRRGIVTRTNVTRHGRRL